MAARGTPGRFELTALLALASALSALGIDLMLPAFDHIRADLGLAAGSTAVAGLVTTYFLGLATGQLIYGPLSDRYGRRPALYAGFGIYALGAGAAALAPSLGLLLFARFVWGLGAAGPRVVTQAVIRDTYEGDAMAKAMSLVMALFVLVPIVAPSLGAAVVSVTSWRWLFVGCMAATLAMALWTRRLPETLHPEHRLELRFGRVASAARMVVSDRQALGYTLAQTALYGAFMSWIGSAESIISDTFDQEGRFPIIFGAMGAVIGIAMLTNARIVHRFTARRVVHAVLFVYLGAAATFVAVGAATDGEPPLAVFLLILVTLVACHALLIPNCTSIAMAPMAAVAGTAASLMGAALIAGGAVLGSFVDGAFDGTIRPLATGFLGYGILGFTIILWAERGRLFQRSDVPDEEAGLLVVEAL